MPIVKANAYGHGLVPVCEALYQSGIRKFGIATIDEGEALKQKLPDATVVLLGGCLPEQAEAVLDVGLVPVVYTMDQALALSTEASRRDKILPVHIKIDTGMTRLGVRYDEALAFIEKLASLRGIGIVGLMTHLATADALDSSFTMLQLDRFDAAVGASGLSGEVLLHAANSAALLRYSRARYSLVRPGLMLYGMSPTGSCPPGITLRPMLKLVSRIVRTTNALPGESVGYGQTFVSSQRHRVAIVPIGYADGFRYSLSTQAEVLIGGLRCPVIGTVSMDMIAVGLRDGCQAKVGDEVVLIGAQGREMITAHELAFLAQTLPYEILCGLSERIDRVYVEGPCDG